MKIQSSRRNGMWQIETHKEDITREKIRKSINVVADNIRGMSKNKVQVGALESALFLKIPFCLYLCLRNHHVHYVFPSCFNPFGFLKYRFLRITNER